MPSFGKFLTSLNSAGRLVPVCSWEARGGGVICRAEAGLRWAPVVSPALPGLGGHESPVHRVQLKEVMVG